MPRTVDTDLAAALASDDFLPYMQALFYTGVDDTLATYSLNVLKYNLTGTTLVIYCESHPDIADIGLAGWVVLERGVVIDGEPLTLKTSRLSTTSAFWDGWRFRVFAELLPVKRLNLYGDTWRNTLDDLAVQLGFLTVYKDDDEEYWDNQMYEAGQGISLPKASDIRYPLSQRLFAGYCDNGGQEILFYSAAKTVYDPGLDETITVSGFLEIQQKNPETNYAIGLRWTDESGLSHQPAAPYDTLPLRDIGFVRTGDVLPTDDNLVALSVKRTSTRIEPITVPINFTYQDGDRAKIRSSVYIDLQVYGRLKVVEYFDPERTPSWGLDLSLWDYAGYDSQVEAASVPLGESVIPDGGFDTNLGSGPWITKPIPLNGWTLDGQAHAEGVTTGILVQKGGPFLRGRAYRLVYTIVSISLGAVQAVCGNVRGTPHDAPGTYVELFGPLYGDTQDGTSGFMFRAYGASFLVCVIDSVAAYEVTSADAYDTDNHVDGAVNAVFTLAEREKLAAVEAGAEVNNISDADAAAVVGHLSDYDNPHQVTAAQVGAKQVLTSANTYYVDCTDGDDSAGDGSSGDPWKTIQKAVDHITSFDNGGYDQTIRLVDNVRAVSASRARASNVATIVTQAAHGLSTGNKVVLFGSSVNGGYTSVSATITVIDSTTFTYASTGANEATTADANIYVFIKDSCYASTVCKSFVGSGTLYIWGNGRNTLVRNLGDGMVMASTVGAYYFKDFAIIGGTYHINMLRSYCSVESLYMGDGVMGLTCLGNSYLQCVTKMYICGNFSFSPYGSSSSSNLRMNTCDHEIMRPITVGAAYGFAYVKCSYINAQMSSTTFTNPTNVTGLQHNVVANGVIDTNGATMPFFPGTVAGTKSTGGQVI